jgi:DNA-binding transcriptional ArsR family regulator
MNGGIMASRYCRVVYFDISRNIVDSIGSTCYEGVSRRREPYMETKQAIAALAALAQETRLAIFRMLVEAGPSGLPAGIIAERLDMPASSLSFHLAHLTRAGLLAQERQSRSLIYSADFAATDALVGYLTENCCGRGAASCLPRMQPATTQPVAIRTLATRRKRR